MQRSLEKIFKELKTYTHLSNSHLSYYDIVYVLHHEDQSIVKVPLTSSIKLPVIFTHVSHIARMYDLNGSLFPPTVKHQAIMVGELIDLFEKETGPTPVLINPQITAEGKYQFDNTLIIPTKDSHTKKLLLSDPEEAKALYAINPQDQKRFGIEFVFYIQTQNEIPEDEYLRPQTLKERIELLSYIIPRTPIKKGSASFIAVILDLENDMEETAFIRPYKTMDAYTNVIFLNTDYKLYTGELENIPYLSQTVDDLFNGLIKWGQNKKRRPTPESRP